MRIAILFISLFFVLQTAAQDLLNCSVAVYDTVLIGQPMMLEYRVTSHSQVPNKIFYDPEGSVYNNLGRNEDFNVTVTGPNQEVLPTLPIYPLTSVLVSKLVGHVPIREGDSLNYTLWIDNWVDLDTVGTYNVTCSKRFTINGEESFELSCSTEFLVVDCDSLSLDKWISKYMVQITASQPGFFRSDALHILCRVKNPAVVPYLGSYMITSASRNEILHIADALSNFPFSLTAFEYISKAVELPGSRFVYPGSRQDLLEEQQASAKHILFHDAAAFADSLFIPFGLSFQDDSDFSMRNFLMQELYRRNSEYLPDLLQKYKDDPSEVISKQARRLLRQRRRRRK